MLGYPQGIEKKICNNRHINRFWIVLDEQLFFDLLGLPQSGCGRDARERVMLVQDTTHDLLVEHWALVLSEALHTRQMFLQLRGLHECPGNQATIRQCEIKVKSMHE